jgi:hypothetical protein
MHPSMGQPCFDCAFVTGDVFINNRRTVNAVKGHEVRNEVFTVTILAEVRVRLIRQTCATNVPIIAPGMSELPRCE